MQASNKQLRHECRAAQTLLLLAVKRHGARNMQITERNGWSQTVARDTARTVIPSRSIVLCVP